jgi:hypothetical protein
MTEAEQNLLNALDELDGAVRSMPTANPKPNLMPLFERIDHLGTQLPEGTDPNLSHYIQRKSYEKARLFLQGRSAENRAGSCGSR